MMFRWSSLILLTSFFACTTAAAHPSSAGGYSVRLEDQYGNALQAFGHRGRTYVLGTFSQRYNVRVSNHTGSRIEAVVTIDGRDAISGRQGNFRERGYVIPPYQDVLVEGFRQNHHAVAVFRFTNKGDSYSARRGTPQNVGVIGVAVFREKHRRRHHPRPLAKRGMRRPTSTGADLDDLAADSAAPARESRAKSRSNRAPRQNNIGTRYGESQHSEVVEVRFRRRRNRPDHILSVHYDDASGLQARGISVYPPYYSGSPEPFPHRDFAPPPW